MKNFKLIRMIGGILLITSCTSSDSFKDAVSAWTFSDLNDITLQNSKLEAHGEVLFVLLERRMQKHQKKEGEMV